MCQIIKAPERSWEKLTGRYERYCALLSVGFVVQLESFCHWWPRCRKDTGHGACEDAPARIFPSVATNKPGKHNPSPRLSSGSAKTPLCWHLLPWCHTEHHLTPWGHAAAPQTRGQHRRGHWRPGMTPGSQNREEGKGWKLSVSSGVIITRVITRVHAAGMEFWAPSRA